MAARVVWTPGGFTARTPSWQQRLLKEAALWSHRWVLRHSCSMRSVGDLFGFGAGLGAATVDVTLQESPLACVLGIPDHSGGDPWGPSRGGRADIRWHMGTSECLSQNMGKFWFP